MSKVDRLEQCKVDVKKRSARLDEALDQSKMSTTSIIVEAYQKLVNGLLSEILYSAEQGEPIRTEDIERVVDSFISNIKGLEDTVLGLSRDDNRVASNVRDEYYSLSQIVKQMQPSVPSDQIINILLGVIGNQAVEISRELVTGPSRERASTRMGWGTLETMKNGENEIKYARLALDKNKSAFKPGSNMSDETPKL